MFAHKISVTINSASEKTNNVLLGNYSTELKISSSDEINKLSANLIALSNDLKGKVDFANQISAGNLEAVYHVSGKTDILGKALFEIKENLVRIKSEERQRTWITDALSKFVEILRINKDLKEIANDIIINLAKTLRANQGAIFLTTKDELGIEYLDMKACYAYNRTKYLTKKIIIGEGLIGQTYLEKQTRYLKEIPENFVQITSGLGNANPTHLLIVPLKMNEVVVGIIELASFHEFPLHEIEFVEKIGESIAYTINSFRVAQNTRMLLKDAEERAEKLHSQEEELRQNQEELQATQEEISRKYNILFGQLKELNYESKFDQLLSITFAKKRNVEYYFDIIRSQVFTFSEDKMIIDAMKAFAEAFSSVGKNISSEAFISAKQDLLKYYEQEFIPRLNDNIKQTEQAEYYFPEGSKAMVLQYLYISHNPYPTGKKSLLDDAHDGSEYSKVHSIYHPIIRSYLEKFGYYDIFLIDNQTGELVYSVFKEIDFATSLIAGLYSKTNFGRVVQEAMETTDKNFVRLIDFEMYDPSYHAPASFIARPIYSGEAKIGIVVFQMPINKINQILTGDGHWREDGLGKSGETFLVGSDYKLRSITRGLMEEPDHYLTKLRKQGYNDDTIRQISKTHTNILLEEVRLDCVGKALQGSSGKQVEQNAQGIDSLLAFAPLKIPDVNWVIVSTLLEKEASGRIENLRNI